MSPQRAARRTPAARWRDAAAELAARDGVLARMHADHGPPRFRAAPPASRRFEALARAITYQQLHGVAAGRIWARVQEAVTGAGTNEASGPPTPLPFSPEVVLGTDPDRLRGAGLSGAKTAAIVDLARHCAQGDLRLERIGRLDDDEVIEALTVVRGIGPWTAQMFLMFDLRRVDVWPTADYGVRAGFAKAYGLTEMPSEREMLALGEPSRPYRSVLAWWCWREMDTATP